MTSGTETNVGAAQLALDKLEAAETVTRFYHATQVFDCTGTQFDAIGELIADEMLYLSTNLRGPDPLPRDEFLALYKKVHDVHARPGRGSYYNLSTPIVTVDGDKAHVAQNLDVCHWLSDASENSTWFYGAIETTLIRSDRGWLIAKLDVSGVVRTEGHEPPVNYLHPDIDQG